MPIYTDINKNHIVRIGKKQHSSTGSAHSNDGDNNLDGNNDIIKDIERIASARKYNESPSQMMVPKLIQLPYELQAKEIPGGFRKQGTPRMAHYHYFYELYK